MEKYRGTSSTKSCFYWVFSLVLGWGKKKILSGGIEMRRRKRGIFIKVWPIGVTLRSSKRWCLHIELYPTRGMQVNLREWPQPVQKKSFPLPQYIQGLVNHLNTNGDFPRILVGSAGTSDYRRIQSINQLVGQLKLVERTGRDIEAYDRLIEFRGRIDAASIR